MILGGFWMDISLLFGWEGFWVESRNCFDSISLCSLTGIIFVSLCRCSIGVFFTHPVAILNAVFWAVCKFSQLLGLRFGV